MTPTEGVVKRYRGIAHALYWKLHSSYLTHKQTESDRFAGMLSEYSDESILQEIGEIHFKRYNQIRENIRRHSYGRIYAVGQTAPILRQTFARQEKSCKEKEFCDILSSKEGRSKLSELLKLSESCSILREFELQEYGRVDLLVRDGRKVFPIEVKMLTSNGLVSQIDRYVLALELDMNLGLHDFVIPVVIAENFPTYASIELSRSGVIMIMHQGTIESLTVL